jgi:hypothetical protein
MRKYVNGEYIDLTPSELAEIESAQRKAEIIERHRPLTESEVSRMIITQQINTLTVDDQTALRMMEYYPAWEDLCKQSVTAEKAGYKFTYGGKLWKTRQPIYTFVSHYVPGVGTESLFERIDETHDGSEFDPIPYEGNMALENGKYYTQNGVMYKCIRDTGNPVYNALADLVGIYVEEVKA